MRYDTAPLIERVRVPASILRGALETQVGIWTGKRLTALRPDLPFDSLDGTKACLELERPNAVVELVRRQVGAAVR